MGFAIILLIGFVALMTKNGATDVTAYRRGKEAPSMEKYRIRHREKADKKLTAPKKSGGKEPGPLGQWARAVADNAAAELIEKQETKSQARRKWYRENAPQREEQWREKWQSKLDKREQQLEKFKHKRGLGSSSPATVEGSTTDSPADQQVPAPETTSSGQPQLSDEQAQLVQSWRRATQAGENHSIGSKEWFGLPVSVRAQLIDEAQQQGMTPTAVKDGEPTPMSDLDAEAAALLRRQGKHVSSDPAPAPPSKLSEPRKPVPAPRPAASTKTSTNPSTTGGTVYEQGVQELRESAEQIRQFCQDMDTFADALSGRGFGTEITGTATEASQTLNPAGDIYADLAEQIQQEGDDVGDAHDRTGHQIPDEAAMA